MTLCKLVLSLKAGVKIHPICCARPAVACHVSLTSCYLSIEREYTFWNPEFEFERKKNGIWYIWTRFCSSKCGFVTSFILKDDVLNWGFFSFSFLSLPPPSPQYPRLLGFEDFFFNFFFFTLKSGIFIILCL